MFANSNRFQIVLEISILHPERIPDPFHETMNPSGTVATDCELTWW